MTKKSRFCGALGGLLAPLAIQACQDSNEVCEPVVGNTGATRNVCYEIGDFGQSTLAISNDEPPGVNCPTGGKRVASGFDDNANGQLDASEVDATVFIC